MHDAWNSEVQQALGSICDEIEQIIGVRPEVELDHSAFQRHVVKPKFAIPPRLEHFSKFKTASMSSGEAVRARGRRNDAVQVVGEVWRRRKAEYPDLWSYTQWYAKHLANPDTRELSGDSYAERMRMKRRARLEKTEVATASQEVGFQEVDQGGEATCGSGPDGGGTAL